MAYETRKVRAHCCCSHLHADVPPAPHPPPHRHSSALHPALLRQAGLPVQLVRGPARWHQGVYQTQRPVHSQHRAAAGGPAFLACAVAAAGLGMGGGGVRQRRAGSCVSAVTGRPPIVVWSSTLIRCPWLQGSQPVLGVVAVPVDVSCCCWHCCCCCCCCRRRSCGCCCSCQCTQLLDTGATAQLPAWHTFHTPWPACRTALRAPCTGRPRGRARTCSGRAARRSGCRRRKLTCRPLGWWWWGPPAT